MSPRRKPKPQPAEPISEGEWRGITALLHDWAARREGPSPELRARQERLLRILAK